MYGAQCKMKMKFVELLKISRWQHQSHYASCMFMKMPLTWVLGAACRLLKANKLLALVVPLVPSTENSFTLCQLSKEVLYGQIPVSRAWQRRLDLE